MWFIVLAGILLAFLSWLLFAPFSLVIDSYQREMFLKWWGLGRAEVLFRSSELLIRVKAFFWSWEFYPLRFKADKKQKEEKARPPSRKKKKKKPFPLRRVVRILKSFQVKEMQIEIDSGDYVQNARLFPLFYAIPQLRKRVTVNFQGRNECRLNLSNQIWRIAWAFIRP